MDVKQLMQLAYREASNSPDPSTQNGALLVRPDGSVLIRDHNRLPNGTDRTEERYVRPLKYRVTGHAEVNVIFAAARTGITTNDLVLVCPWAACSQCAVGIIEAGIKKLIGHKSALDRLHNSKHMDWRADIEIALQLFEESGVKIEWFEGKADAVPVRFDYKTWEP